MNETEMGFNALRCQAETHSLQVTCSREVTHPVIATTWTDFSPLHYLSADRCKRFLRDASVTLLAITRTGQTRVNI